MNIDKYTLFYDGECPFCKVEINNLKRMDRKQVLNFIDITDSGFEAEMYGFEQKNLMFRIHALKPNGKVEKGMDVIRYAYTAVGLGLVAKATALPVVRESFERLYGWFADNRVPMGNLVLKLTGRER